MIDLSTLEACKQLATKYATKYSLPVELVCAVAEQESGWRPFAARYEKDFYATYIQPMLDTNGVHPVGTCSLGTEARFRATSFGLMQLIGLTAREFGFTGEFLSELCDPDTGMEFGCKKLAHCMANAHNDQHIALLHYNGGKSQDYPVQVMARLATYGESDTRTASA